MLAAAGAAAAALLLSDHRARLAAMAIALAVAPVLVLGSVWDEPRVVDFRESPAQVGVSLVVMAAALALFTVCFRRWPGSFAVAAFATLPLRVPVEIGGETANLLVPLYLVIAAGLIAASVDRTPPTADHLPPTADRRPRPWSTWLHRLLAATVLLYAIQASYSEDVANAIENLGFFLVPFAVMFALLIEVSWTKRLVGAVLVAVGAVAVFCALVAIYQWLAGDLFLNPELFDANQLHVYFRVNSIFFDPNILGRYLGLAITALGAYIAWSDDRRRPVPIAAALAVCALALAGLAFSFSISSFAALIAGLGVVAMLRWGWRGAASAAGLGLAGLAALLIAGGTPGSDIQTDRGIDSGRSDLIAGGIELAGDRPIGGYGSGSFGAAFVERIDDEARTVVSHSEPITAAAEQGVIGLILYTGLVVCALFVVLGGAAGASAGRTAVAACFVAVLVHSLGYAGFAIDPATWALLGLGVALRRNPPEASATMPV